jgi:quercetin dioxygenase-like cupin family protein
MYLGGSSLDTPIRCRTVNESTTRASWSGPGKGEQLWFLGTLATITVSGEASEGRFALIDFLFPRHASPPLHTHPQDESYIVLNGQLTVQAGEQRFQLMPGATAVVPMGRAHLPRGQRYGSCACAQHAGGARATRAGRLGARNDSGPPPERDSTTVTRGARRHLPSTRSGQPGSAACAQRLTSINSLMTIPRLGRASARRGSRRAHRTRRGSWW